MKNATTILVQRRGRHIEDAVIYNCPVKLANDLLPDRKTLRAYKWSSFMARFPYEPIPTTTHKASTEKLKNWIKQIKAANAKRDAILEDYSKLVSDKNSFLLKMRTMLESELAITNHVIDLLPKVGEVAKTPAPENKPVEKIAPAEPAPKVEEKIPAPIEEIPSNIVDISSKPTVTDDTMTYAPAKEVASK